MIITIKIIILIHLIILKQLLYNCNLKINNYKIHKILIIYYLTNKNKYKIIIIIIITIIIYKESNLINN